MAVFYRKYRPQKISDLDLEVVRKRIFSVLSSERIPHAFLLTGPRGLGKTSVARIIAKSVNCLKRGKNGEPCGVCEMCTSITLGTNLDVLEIDGASHRGIDEIRDLREKVRLAPSSAKYKVYIIDEVHMLTTEAFNALLKTLEEPPARVIFILCTTEPHKLPATVISRCSQFEFKYPTTFELVASLKRVVDGEKLNVDGRALELIAKGSRGSFRDAQKILDQLSLENKIVTQEMVSSFLGRDRFSSYEEFLRSLEERDTKRALEWINNELSKGTDLKVLTEFFLEIFHDVLLRKAAGFSPNTDLNEGYFENLSVHDVKRLISLFSRAYLELKSAVIPQLPLELAIIDWGETEYQISNIKNQKFDNREGSKPSEEPKELKKEKVEDVSRRESPSSADILALWPKVLATVKPHNHSVEALLRSSRPLSLDNDLLTLEVFYKFHKERLEQPKILELLSKVCSEVMGVKTRVKCVLGNKATPEKPKIEKQDDDLAKAAEEIFGT